MHRCTIDYSCQFAKCNWKKKDKKGLRNLTFESKKTGCNASIQVKEVSLFGLITATHPERKSQRVHAASVVRKQIESSDPTAGVQKIFFLRISLEHTTHPRHNFVSSNNRINPAIAKEIQNMATMGVTQVSVARILLGYNDPSKKQRRGNRNHPSNRTIGNHLHIGAKKRRNSPDDQLDLLVMVYFVCNFGQPIVIQKKMSSRFVSSFQTSYHIFF